MFNHFCYLADRTGCSNVYVYCFIKIFKKYVNRAVTAGNDIIFKD